MQVRERPFDQTLKQTGHLAIVFYAPWCPHCKKFLPEWDKVEAKFAGHEVINVARVDTTNDTRIGERMAVENIPSLRMFVCSDGPGCKSSAPRSYTYNGPNVAHKVTAWIGGSWDEDSLVQRFGAEYAQGNEIAASHLQMRQAVVAERLTAFYEEHDPSKLAGVKKIATKYKGNVERFFEMLTTKYLKKLYADKLGGEGAEAANKAIAGIKDRIQAYAEETEKLEDEDGKSRTIKTHEHVEKLYADELRRLDSGEAENDADHKAEL